MLSPHIWGYIVLQYNSFKLRFRSKFNSKFTITPLLNQLPNRFGACKGGGTLPQINSIRIEKNNTLLINPIVNFTEYEIGMRAIKHGQFVKLVVHVFLVRFHFGKSTIYRLLYPLAN